MTIRAMSSPLDAPKPWYRDRWPWLLMAGPAIVVVAGLVTAWIAVTSDDGLVAPDYYKRGLLINKEIDRSNRAVALKLGATVLVAADGRVEVALTATGEQAPAPDRLSVSFGRAARAGEDIAAVLPRSIDGRYTGRIALPPPSRWRVTLEAGDWRLATDAAITLPGEFRLGSARDVD
jgi:hypothetical protein